LAREVLYQPAAFTAAGRPGSGVAPHPGAVVYIGNLGKELSVAAKLTLKDKLTIMEQYVGKPIIDAVIVGPKVDISAVSDRVVIQGFWRPACSYRHDRHLLREALEKAIQALG
jgi:2-phospho-L-lactate transferase/gluconeogenesis factor (CofD/UPF0052 family)